MSHWTTVCRKGQRDKIVQTKGYKGHNESMTRKTLEERSSAVDRYEKMSTTICEGLWLFTKVWIHGCQLQLPFNA